MMKNAVIVASFVYDAANRDEHAAPQAAAARAEEHGDGAGRTVAISVEGRR